MKHKHSLLLAAAACLLTLAACNPEELIRDLIDKNGGELTMTASATTGDSQYYADNDTVRLASLLCDVDGSSAVSRLVGIKGSLTESMIGGGNYPIVSMCLTDSTVGEYTINFPIDNADFLLTLDWKNLATDSSNNNLLLVAVDQENYYLATGGTIAIDSFGVAGDKVRGTVRNAKCKYLQASKVQHIRELQSAIENAASDPERAVEAGRELAAIDWENYFATITFNGSFWGLRADASKYLRAIAALE